jgi:hypothetical protein
MCKSSHIINSLHSWRRVKCVFQPQHSCGPPLSRELTREKHERLFVVDACGVQHLPSSGIFIEVSSIFPHSRRTRSVLAETLRKPNKPCHARRSESSREAALASHCFQVVDSCGFWRSRTTWFRNTGDTSSDSSVHAGARSIACVCDPARVLV